MGTIKGATSRNYLQFSRFGRPPESSKPSEGPECGDHHGRLPGPSSGSILHGFAMRVRYPPSAQALSTHKSYPSTCTGAVHPRFVTAPESLKGWSSRIVRLAQPEPSQGDDHGEDADCDRFAEPVTAAGLVARRVS